MDCPKCQHDIWVNNNECFNCGYIIDDSSDNIIQNHDNTKITEGASVRDLENDRVFINTKSDGKTTLIQNEDGSLQSKTTTGEKNTNEDQQDKINEKDISHKRKDAKKTLFLDEFNNKRNDKLSFELVPIGNDEVPLKFYKEEVVLARNEIDNEDLSISKSDHLVIKKEDGKWVVENTSSNGAVFIMVKGKTVLDENDILIIGTNKLFCFKPAD